MTTSNAPGQDIVSAAVRALFNRATQEQSSELYYQTLGLTDYEPDVPEEQLNEVSGPGKGILTVEGQQFGSNEKYRGYPVTGALRKYTSELSWTEEDIHWLEKANAGSKRAIDFKSMPSQAIQALYQNVNEDACKVYYLGFGTTFLNVGNSEALFGSHTIRKTGASQKNTFPTATGSGINTAGHAPLASAALTDAIKIMNRFKSHNDTQLLRVKKLKLIVAVENRATADQIVWSDYGPTNANLGLQTSSQTMLEKRGHSLEVVEAYDFPVAYATYWFLMCEERAKNRAFMGWGWKPRMNDDNDYTKGVYMNEASVLFGPVILGWSFAFGSKGDASAS